MRYLLRHPVIASCLGVALLLGYVILALLFQPGNDKPTFEAVEIGRTTDADVETMFGPPFQTWPMALTPDQVRRRGLQERGDGQPVIVTCKQWWRDECSWYAEIDDAGIVVEFGGPSVAPPRSPIKRWWRRQLERFE